MKLLARMMTILSFLIMVQYANAGNSIYMDQIGDGTSISITQSGAGNSVGSISNRSTFTGDNNTVTVQQIGNNNANSMKISGDGATVSSITTGSSNIINLECGANGGSCGPSTITKTVTGDGNQVNMSTDSLTNTTLSITSDNNTVNINSTASSVAGTTNTVDISGGSGNTLDITQAGAGAASGSVGHQVDLAINGALNIVDFRQGGTVDSKIVSTITGSSNSVIVKSNHP